MDNTEPICTRFTFLSELVQYQELEIDAPACTLCAASHVRKSNHNLSPCHTIHGGVFKANSSTAIPPQESQRTAVPEV